LEGHDGPCGAASPGRGRRIACVVAFLLAAVIAALAQVSSNVALSNGVQLTIDARTADGSPVALKANLEPASGDSFYRIFRDENNLAVFAYELMVTRTPDGRQFRVTARAATLDFAARFPNADGGKPTPTLSSLLESPLLGSGDKFVIPIPTDPGLAQTLTDTVRIRLNQPGATADAGSDPSAQIRFSALKVSINNQPASPAGAGSVVAGRFAMFYIPGRGGYFFSTAEVVQPPFAQVGIVDGKHLKFDVDNDVYDCVSGASILAHSERGQLWVYHDANYKPAGNWTNSDPESSRQEFFTAAADSLQWWLQ
jgi:hypothetical protein